MGLRPIPKRWAGHQQKKKGEGKTLREVTVARRATVPPPLLQCCREQQPPLLFIPPCGTIFSPTELTSLPSPVLTTWVVRPKEENRGKRQVRGLRVIFRSSPRVNLVPLCLDVQLVVLAMSVFRATQDRLEEIEVLMCFKEELDLDVCQSIVEYVVIFP